MPHHRSFTLRQAAACAAVLLLTRIASPIFAESVTTQKGEILPSPRSGSSPTRLLFAFATNQGGFDTEIAIANTSADPFGTTPTAGSCALTFYGGTTAAPTTPPPPVSTGTIAAGASYVQLLSTIAPTFQGYVFASCAFPLGRGSAKISGGTSLAFSQDAQVISTPRTNGSPQRLLFPYITNQAGLDSGIVIANTSSDPFGINGATPTAGSCTLNFYGGTTASPTTPPAPVSTFNIAAGTVYANTVSQIAPTFQGYVIATCNFSNAAGLAFVADVGARTIALSETPELLTLPRATTVRPLLFSSVSNQGGFDTGITIANTSADPFGTASSAGTCTLNFYGSNAPSPFVTPTLAAGSVYGTVASWVAPGFRGYVTAVCTFPYARGWAFTAPVGLRSDGDSETPEIVTTPRSVAPAPLLFSAVSNWNNNGTAITISNTSQDSFGTAQASGTCTLSYFGNMVGGGSTPASQTSATIQPGSQLSFSLGEGNPAQGIAATPGFKGYLIADCSFPLARGVATVTLALPGLTITKTHVGNFSQGQTNATYTVTVSNRTGFGPTSGAVTVTETVPTGMTLVSMTGSAWTCATNTCTRSDSLSPGASYPAIAVTVNVASNASSPLVNQVGVSGGGSAAANTTDSTIITASGHPAFFTGEVALANSVYSLQLPDGNPFGYYGYLSSGWIYHFDLGYLSVTAGSGPEVYLWDLASGHWWYTNSGTFPYLYDFMLKTWIYYFPDTHNAGHYTTNPRYFANMSTNQVFTM